MTERITGRQSQAHLPRYATLIRILQALALSLALGACASDVQAPATADITEDPALSNDPAMAAQLEENSRAPQWTWRDGEQRWRYVGTADTAPRVAIDGWVFEPGTLQLRIAAAPQLNSYLNRPHATVLRVIQLADLKPFEDRRTTRFGLQEMLSIDAFDPAAVLAVNQFSLLPGSDQMIAIDRMQNARYIGIVAGFYGLDGRRTARLIPVPAMDDTPTTVSWLNRLTFGFLDGIEAVPPRPAKLKMLLQLGVDQIDELKVHAH